jgi:NAD(P)-dependent dehydrogenase (short-subunit alcohol dehydrogenase family)
MWALDELARAGIAGSKLNQIGAQFRKFMYLNVPYDLVLVSHVAGTVRAELCADRVVITSIQLRDGERQASSDAALFGEQGIPTDDKTPRTPALSELSSACGWVQALPNDVDELARLFPSAAGAISVSRMAALAALSRLVGMVCPGLHSLFAGLTVDLVEMPRQGGGIGFKVTTVNDRYRVIGMDVTGCGLAGTVRAFMRWPPVEAPSMDAITQIVEAGAFAGAVALIVGGSRGLGAVTAKAVAAGGGKVVVTYQRGRVEAQGLAAEICAMRGAGACVTFAYDSSDDPAAQLSAVTTDINQIYYFATPPIIPQLSDLFAPQVFHNFCTLYLDGFHNVCRFARSHSRAPVLRAFYPSSVFVEQRPAGLTEYAMAKAAGELLCTDMMRQIAGLSILVARLPRVLTDQTAIIAQAETADPLAVMLPIIRQMHNSV